MSDLQSRIKARFERIEETLPGYTYYLIAFGAIAFFTPIFESRLFGESSIALQVVVLAAGPLLFIALYWPTYRDVFKRILGLG